ncbi:TPA_asm: P3 [Wurfbainia alphacytorhabdovirus 1]|nr:TPA_asm: P3 [Wurfbainia alphacytorhabdovirus 1]
MKGIITANDARAIIASDGSIITNLNPSKIYDGKYRSVARKREVNVKIIANMDRYYMMRCFPLFDKHDISEMRMETDTNKYVHIGCISISIEPLIHQRFLDVYGKGITGICAVVDTSFLSLEQSIISLHKFSLSSRRADFICQPNHCLSLTDDNLLRRISVLIIIDNIQVQDGCELFNICVGHITTSTNTLHPGSKDKTMTTVALNGAESIRYNDVKEKLEDAFKETKSRGSLELEPEGEETIKMQKKNIFQRLGLITSPKVTIRRSFSTKLVQPSDQIARGKDNCNVFDPHFDGDSIIRRTQSLPRNSLDLAIRRCAREGLLSHIGSNDEKEDYANIIKKVRERRDKMLESVGKTT